jgi:hypothetical protein
MTGTPPDGVSIGQVSQVSDTIPDMTPTSPTDLAGPDPLTATIGSPSGGVGVITPPEIWYLAACHRCNPLMEEPFTDSGERDDWAAEHIAKTGHVVLVSLDGEARGHGHHGGVLARTERLSGFRWMCTTEDDHCRRWNGPYVSAQLALASFASHGRARS